MIGYFPQGKVFICLSGEYKGLAFFFCPLCSWLLHLCSNIVGGELSGLPTLLHTNIFLVRVRVRVNQPPNPQCLHQLAFLSIGWASWFASFSFVSLPSVNKHSTTLNLFWLLTFDHFSFHCQFFPNLHTTYSPSYPADLNLSPAYKLTTNLLLTLAKLFSLLR